MRSLNQIKTHEAESERIEREMENLHHGNLRYDLFVTRFQGIKPSSSKNLLFKTLKYISSSDATSAAASATSPAFSEAENSQIASVVSAYEQECRRVALFYRSQHQQLWNALLEVVGLLRSKADFYSSIENPALLAPCSSPATGRVEKLTTIRALLDALGEKVVALDAFAKANVEAAAELALVGDGKKSSTPMFSSTTPSLPISSVLVNNEDMDQIAREYATAAEAALLGVLRLDPIILGLSDAYALLTIVEESEAEGIAAAAAAAVHNFNGNGFNTTHSSSSLTRWVAPQKFKRTTRKFWIKLSDVALFKTEVIKHLPILVYGDRHKITEIDPADLPFTLPPLSESDSSPISSVYLDSLPAGLPSYHSRLRREDGATAVRLRWYGERNPEDPFQQIFVEKKVHVVGSTINMDNNFIIDGGGGENFLDGEEREQQQKPAGQTESEKQRVALPQSEIPALLSGQPVAVPKKFSKEDFEFLQDVQTYIVEDSHVPVLRTCYSRTAFQHDSHNRVRISMDTDLRMVRDYIPIQASIGGSGSGSGGGITSLQWCRNDVDIATAGSTDTVHFPYAVIEVKLQINPPDWLQNLVRKEILLPVPKFSKFLHGSALLYQQHVENVPHWFLPNSNYNATTAMLRSKSGKGLDDALPTQQQLQYLPMTPATWEEMVAPSAEAVSDAALWLFPASNPDLNASEGDGRQKEEEERRVTQAKPGLLWRWRGGARSSKGGQEVQLNNISSSSTTATATATTTPVSIPVPNTASSPAAGSLNGGEKYEAPGTPDGASPRAGDIVAPISFQDQMMLELMMNTDDSSSVMTSNLTRRDSGQRCPSSPRSSSSVSSLLSSAEGGGGGGGGSGGAAATTNINSINNADESGSGHSLGEQTQQSPQGVTPSWQVFQEQPLSPSVPLAAVGGLGAGVAENDADLESGNGGGGGNTVATTNVSSLSPSVVFLPGAAAVGAEAAAETKPASRKSSLVHLVSSIPGLGGIANGGNKSKNDTMSSAGAAENAAETAVEKKNSFRSGYPLISAKEGGDEDNKKEESLLPSYSIISSPSLPGNPRGTSSAPPRAMVRTRVEPKTFFANERTFLQWLQISVLVMFLGLNLLNGSMLLPGGSSSSSSSSGICASNDSKCIASKISGALIAPVALLFMAYALFMYRQRTRQILRRESVRYDDQRGPAILVAILLTVMLISYVIAMIYVF